MRSFRHSVVPLIELLASKSDWPENPEAGHDSGERVWHTVSMGSRAITSPAKQVSRRFAIIGVEPELEKRPTDMRGLTRALHVLPTSRAF